MEYDNSLDIQSSIRNDFDINFQKDIEPGVVHVFDFIVQQKETLTLKINGKQTKFMKKEIRMAGLEDKDFHIDKVIFQEEFKEETTN